MLRLRGHLRLCGDEKMFSMKKLLFLVVVFISFQLFFSTAVIATPPLKRADVFIKGKYSRPISFDKRLLDRRFRRTLRDREDLVELLQTRETSYVPHRITTSAGTFYVSVNTEVTKDGFRIEIDDLLVPSAAYVFFYQPADGVTPSAVKIVVNDVGGEASPRWLRAPPQQIMPSEPFSR